jgi:hypothetical protein
MTVLRQERQIQRSGMKYIALPLLVFVSTILAIGRPQAAHAVWYPQQPLTNPCAVGDSCTSIFYAGPGDIEVVGVGVQINQYGGYQYVYYPEYGDCTADSCTVYATFPGMSLVAWQDIY